MKKLILLSTSLLTVAMLYAEPQAVQPVVDITPGKVELADIKPLSLPPTVIKAADLKAVDLKMTTSPNNKAAKSKKVLAEMSQEEQVTYLKHKIDKLRKKSHATRAKIHALENELAALKQEIKDLKENKVSKKTQGE